MIAVSAMVILPTLPNILLLPMPLQAVLVHVGMTL